jgi:hypothetical protein
MIFEPQDDVPVEVMLYPELRVVGWRSKVLQSEELQPESQEQVLTKGRQIPLRLQSSSVWHVGVQVEATATIRIEMTNRKERIVKTT